MMAQSCFDPEAAVGLCVSPTEPSNFTDKNRWQRMENVNKMATPQFLSTHPSVGKLSSNTLEQDINMR